MGIMVHVVDATIHSDSKRFDQYSTRGSTDVVVRIGAACNGIVQAISEVRKATTPGSIDALVFYGHGAGGVQGVSMGKDGTGVREMAAITLTTLDDPAFTKELQALSPHFSGTGAIVLRGCNVAEGAGGGELLRKLARVAGVPVKGSDWFQIVGRTDLAGNILTATPMGTVTEDTRSGIANLGALPVVESVLLMGVEFYDRFMQTFSGR